MIYLRSAVFNLIMFATCAALTLWLRVTTPLTERDRILSTGQLWARITLAALRRCCHIQVALRGQEFLPPGGPAIIAPQHQSAFDIMIWLTMLPRPAYVLKQELLGIPLFGPLLPASGFIAVDRQGGARSLRKMVEECRAAIAQGRQIVIFPEGTRVPPGSRGSIQPGVLALARALDLPVIPAATDSGRFWGRHAFRKIPGTITVTLYPPLAAAHRGLQAELARIYYGAAVDKPVNESAG